MTKEDRIEAVLAEMIAVELSAPAVVTCPDHPYLVLGLVGDEIGRCPACEAEDDEIAGYAFEGPAS